MFAHREHAMPLMKVESSDGTFPYPLPYNNRYRYRITVTVTDINYFEGAKKYGYGYKLFRESKKIRLRI